ncbi:MAG TPA: hypothetical protein VLX92_27750 [Kofleriaceae bacterium]|nr:hypothetical protein [Kofleriaceae bacterium]
MRALVLGGMFAAGVAYAGPKPASPRAAIEAILRANIAGLPKFERDAQKLGIEPSTIAYLTTGTRATVDDNGTFSDNFYGDWQATIEHKPATPTIVIDASGELAWFQAPYTIAADSQNPDGKRDVLSWVARLGGIAVRKDGVWHLAVAAYSYTISDRELFATEPRGDWDKVATVEPELHGDAALAKAFAGWFASGFAAHAGPAAQLVASGSSPGEFRTGAGALPLVKSWDGLGLYPLAIEATQVAGGKAAIVRADVQIPVKKTGHAARLELFAVVVRDGGDWRWVSLQYGKRDY